MYIFFGLNWSSYMLYTILSKLHIWEKSGSQIMAQNGIIQSDFSNINISRLAGRIELIFFYGVKSFRGIQWMLNDFIFLRVRARACISHQEYFYLSSVEFYSMYIIFYLKLCCIMVLVVLQKLPVQEKAIFWVIAENVINQWNHVWCYKTLRGSHWI